jgi:hypothetical protein
MLNTKTLVADAGPTVSVTDLMESKKAGSASLQSDGRLRKLTIVFHHAGGGHRSTADALKDALASQHSPWEVSLLNVQELLAPLDVARRATGLHIEDAYNLILRKGWTRFSPQLLVLLQSTIRVYHSRLVKLLRAHWEQHPTDLVLSVIPHFNRQMAHSLRGNGTKTPFVTLLTDLADYPPRFWIEPESEFIIAGTERAKQQALAMGHAADRVFQTSGMVLKPRRAWVPSDGRYREETGSEQGRCPIDHDLWTQPQASRSAQKPKDAEANARGGLHFECRALHGVGGLFRREARAWIDQRSASIPFAGDCGVQREDTAARTL